MHRVAESDMIQSQYVVSEMPIRSVSRVGIGIGLVLEVGVGLVPGLYAQAFSA